MTETSELEKSGGGFFPCSALLGAKTMLTITVDWNHEKDGGWVVSRINNAADQCVLVHSPEHAAQVVEDIIRGCMPTKFSSFGRNQLLDQTRTEQVSHHVVSADKNQDLENIALNQGHKLGVGE